MKVKPSMTTAQLLLWSLFGLILFGYGLLAFNSGVKVSPHFNSTENPDLVTNRIIEQSQINDDIKYTDDVKNTVPLWIRIIAQIKSSEYAFSENSVLSTERYYYQISDTRRTILSTHMMLGCIIMTAGFLQFVPAFRRSFKKAHRALGATYVMAALASMAMSGHHLINSGPENIYSGYIFYVGLWTMLVGVLLSITMATYGILKKNTPMHMGWQALGFGFFLTAPLQRIDWIVVSKFAGDATFDETNILVNTIIFVQATLMAYLIFYINRNSSKKRNSSASGQVIPSNRLAKYSTYLFMACACLQVFIHFCLSPGFENSEVARQLIPQSIRSHHDLVFTSMTLPFIFSVSIASVLFFAVRVFFSQDSAISQKNRNVQAVSVASSCAAIILMYWGYQLGMPSELHSVAGGAYGITGIVLLLFSALFTVASKSHDNSKAKEFLCFVVSLSIAPSMTYLMLSAINLLSIMPESYIAMGHANQAASIFPVFGAVVISYLVAIYSKETKRYSIY